MYALTASMRAKDLAGAEVLKQASIESVTPSLAEPGCLFFDVLFDPEDPLRVRFYEAYVDYEAFLYHSKAEHTLQWIQTCMPVIDKSTIRLPESEYDRGKLEGRTVVVFGATGKIGSELVKLLAQDPRCKEVRALSRRPESLNAQRIAGFGENVRVVSSEMSALGAACAGATDAFVIAPVSDDMKAWHVDVGRALHEAGVDHVVKVSVTGARAPDTVPPPGRFPSLHYAGEQALRDTGLKTTVIRPTIFMQHFEMDTGVYTRGDGAFYLPTGETPVAFLDCRDIAALGHALLLSPAAWPYHGTAFELTGPVAVTGSDIAHALTTVRGDTVTHVDGIEAFEQHCAALGKPDWAKAIYAEAAEGWFSEVSTEVFEAVVGRKPRHFTAYADDRAYWFRG